MADHDDDNGRTLPAGDVGAWVVQMQEAIRDAGESTVPCNGCTACCRSSQFVHIGPDETDTLAHIPRELLFPAPRLPRGHVVLGYDERGHCPMLVDDRCSIYAHRPNACRTYDCRVFAAAGIGMDDDDRPVAQQARRARFSTPPSDERSRLGAVLAAARFCEEHPELLPEDAVTRYTT